ncbi:hypothetical protein TsFJ059_008636 [Trichoderma semiorbis]|uniref:Uncharacterized protein n=1 Tax=Trichoderma semiorbis TaxID=1491008 RepID=A0A9P8HEG4_9HYPO|nr:hypothetical protein TsFJ059_008636 [Trichoderma semiorbis]
MPSSKARGTASTAAWEQVLGSGFSAGDWAIKGLKGPLRQRGVQDAHARGTLAFNGMDFAGRYMNCPEVSTTLCICTYYRRAAARPAAHGGRRNSHTCGGRKADTYKGFMSWPMAARCWKLGNREYRQ